ncbi:MAG: hypothetical protein GXP50_09120, partial [Deltaproteobacteria bacterium]|nr:hypothetical protein [Deltaproteobacteria bacterium]
AVYRSGDGGAVWARVAGGDAVALHVRSAGAGVWVLEPRSVRVLDVAEDGPAVPLERGEQFTSWGWDADRIWLGTNRGLWLWDAVGARRIWQGGRVTSVWPEAGKIFLGTDGLGVQAAAAAGP